MIKGNNLTLINVLYIKPDKNNGIVEHFEVIYRDEEGLVRYAQEPALVDIYFVKPEFRNFKYNKPEERIEHLYKRRVFYSQIRKTIEKESGEYGKMIVERCKATDDWSGMNQLYLWPYSFRADFLPEFYYMQEWFKKYPSEGPYRLSKAFLDIEVDQIDDYVDMDNIPNSALCPVNVATVSFEESKEVFTFLLEPYQPPNHYPRSSEEYAQRMQRYQKQLADHQRLMNNLADFTQDIQDSFQKTYGHLDYHLQTYAREVDLLTDLFKVINQRKPNFCLCWNMRFDIQYLWYRLIKLTASREKAANVICHPDFEIKQCSFRADRHSFQLEKQFDFFYCHSYTHYVCAMRLYASIRKSQHALKSVALDYIADRELKDRKVAYDKEMNIVEFSYLDWPRFIKYNIKDSLLMLQLERKNNDILTYYLQAMLNCTPYQKIFRETYLLRNIREMYFNEDGWVQGNNINAVLKTMERSERKRNIFYNIEDAIDEIDRENEVAEEEESESIATTFKGAIMAEPTMNDNVGLSVLEQSSNIVFVNAMDFDMATFYPSLKILSNMDPITLIGKASLDNSEFTSGQCSNRSLNQTYQELDKHKNIRHVDNTGEAVNTHLTGNVLTMGYHWLSFPCITDLYHIVKREMNK